MRTPDEAELPLALVDMDGTLVDYDGAMRASQQALAAPEETRWALGGPSEDNAPHIEARIKLIRSQPGWWRSLKPRVSGLEIVKVLQVLGFQVHVLTKGPKSTPIAWMEKLQWCQDHLGPWTPVTVSADKGMVYGKILVDDWPPYIVKWLKHRPRGLVIMPSHPWNLNFQHPQVQRMEDTKEAARDAGAHVIQHRKGFESLWNPHENWEMTVDCWPFGWPVVSR